MSDRNNNILPLQPDHVEHAVQLENFYRLMFSLEEVHGVLMWGFWDQVNMVYVNYRRPFEKCL